MIANRPIASRTLFSVDMAKVKERLRPHGAIGKATYRPFARHLFIYVNPVAA